MWDTKKGADVKPKNGEKLLDIKIVIKKAK